jgi:hypothetical protein
MRLQNALQESRIRIDAYVDENTVNGQMFSASDRNLNINGLIAVDERTIRRVGADHMD